MSYKVYFKVILFSVNQSVSKLPIILIGLETDYYTKRQGYGLKEVWNNFYIDCNISPLTLYDYDSHLYVSALDYCWALAP